MQVVKEGHSSSYGHCYIETDGVRFWVHVGSSTYGPYSSMSDAMQEYNHWCP